MPISGLELITVTGKYLNLDGTPASGSITFTSSTVIINTAANEIVYPTNFVALLDVNGAFTITLPSTNDPELNPTGWVYSVTENIDNSTAVGRTFTIALPFDLAGSTIDMADITPAVAGVEYQGYALVSHTHPTADVQVFTASGTWTKPTGPYQTVTVIVFAGGAGGGSGRRGAAGTVRCGGGGGGGGGWSQAIFPYDIVPASQTVAVGTGGAGAPAVTTDDTNGTAGSPGVSSTWGGVGAGGVIVAAFPGAGGLGGTNALGTGGQQGFGTIPPGGGGSASTSGGAPAGFAFTAGAGGGQAGGGITSANVANPGGLGQVTRSTSRSSGAAGAVPGGNGAAPLVESGPREPLPGAGGGSGAASITSAAGSGGNGGKWGGGGGAGGASLNGFDSGAGGNGAPGIVVVITA